MPARIHHVTIAVVDKAAERLSQLPPKQPENVPLSGAIERLRPEINVALNNGYSLDDVVGILRELDEVFTRVSVKTIRRYLEADDTNVGGSRPKNARRQARNSGPRPQPREAGSRSGQRTELPSTSARTGTDAASTPPASAANEGLLSGQNAAALREPSDTQASPTDASLHPNPPPSAVPADPQTSAPTSPPRVAKRSQNSDDTASDNAAFRETM